MSVQAKYLNNKVIMYNPINDKDMLDVLSPVPMNISLNAKNLKQLLFFIKNNKEIKSRINFNKLLANYKNSTAAKNIIQSLEKYIKNKNIRIEDYPSKLFSFISMFYYLKFKSNLYVSILLSYVSIIMPFLRDKFSNRRYHNYMYKIKWPGLKKIELIELFNNLNKNNDVKNKYSIKKHYSGFFIIE